MARTRQHAKGWFRPEGRRSARLQRVSPYAARTAWTAARVEAVRRQFDHLVNEVFAFGAVLLEEDKQEREEEQQLAANGERPRISVSSDVMFAARRVAELQFDDTDSDRSETGGSNANHEFVACVLLEGIIRLQDLAARVAEHELAARDSSVSPPRPAAAQTSISPASRTTARARAWARSSTSTRVAPTPPSTPTREESGQLTAAALAMVRPRSPSISSISVPELPCSDTESISSAIFNRSVKSSSSTETELFGGYSGDDEADTK